MTHDSKDVRRIAVVRPGQLGDLLLAVPGLRALRKGFPQSEITLVARDWAADLPRRLPYIDRVLVLQDVEDASYLSGGERSPSGQAIEDQPYDIVLQLQGDEPWAASLALSLKGKTVIGYCRDEQLGKAFDLLLKMREEEPEVLRVLRLIQSLGIEADGLQLEFPLLPEDIQELEAVPGLAPFLTRRPLVIIHPGARAPARRWPLDRFAELAAHLYHRWGAPLVLTGGRGEEATAERLFEISRVPAANLVGLLSLGSLAALLSKADLFIGNDSGPAQLAAAVASRSIRLFGPANPHRWAPLDKVNHRMLYRKVECSPCDYWECPIDHRCLAEITVEQVLAEVGALLA